MGKKKFLVALYVVLAVSLAILNANVFRQLGELISYNFVWLTLFQLERTYLNYKPDWSFDEAVSYLKKSQLPYSYQCYDGVVCIQVSDTVLGTVQSHNDSGRPYWYVLFEGAVFKGMKEYEFDHSKVHFSEIVRHMSADM